MLKLLYIICTFISALGSSLYCNSGSLSDAEDELRGMFGLTNSPKDPKHEIGQSLSRCSTRAPSEASEKGDTKEAENSSFFSKTQQYDRFEEEILKQPTPIRAINSPLPKFLDETPQEHPDAEFLCELIKDGETATGATLQEYKITRESKVSHLSLNIEPYLHIPPEQYCEIYNQIFELAETNTTFTTKYETQEKLSLSVGKIIPILEDEELEEDATAVISCKISGSKNSAYRRLNKRAARIRDQPVLRSIKQILG